MRSRLRTIADQTSLALLTGITLLGGIVKVALYSPEVVSYQNVGFTIPQIVVFGAFQLFGGLLLLPSRSRFWGASLSTLTFTISAALAIADDYMSIAFALSSVVLIGSYLTCREFPARGHASA